ncbi:MAG: hypothetical protein LAO76_02750 [Acidobacteriia bacterium]|nr:hypothetical protein [Terriglobia bacterium]
MASVDEASAIPSKNSKASVKTQSELVFEQYLESQNLNWSRIPESSRKQPDYRITQELTCVFEVKEFADPKIKPVGGYNPCPPIKEKIQAASEKFKYYRNDCCALVLWNTSIYRSAIPEIVLAAAFGEKVYMNRPPLGAQPSTFHFSGRAELRPDCNTRLSAIVILAPYQLNHVRLEVWRRLDAKRQRGEEIQPSDQFDLLAQVESEGIVGNSYEGTIRTIVLENPYAKIAFPHDLFVGAFDQHWRMESGCFRLSFVGAELQRLESEGVPTIFW